MCLLIVVALAFEFGLAQTDRHIIVLHHVSVCVYARHEKACQRIHSATSVLHPLHIRASERARERERERERGREGDRGREGERAFATYCYSLNRKILMASHISVYSTHTYDLMSRVSSSFTAHPCSVTHICVHTYL